MNKAFPGKKIIPIEILRAVSILLLLYHHSGIYNIPIFGYSIKWQENYFEAFLLGSFFFISGYLMVFSFARRSRQLLEFLKSRFFRIFPPYLVALALYIFVMGITLVGRNLLVYLLGLQFVFAPNFAKPVITLWYIGAIVLFYGFFGIMLRFSRSNTKLILGSVAVFVVAYYLQLAFGLFDVRFFRYFFVFFAGILFARFPKWKESLFSTRFNWLKIGFAAVGIILFALVLHYKSGETSFAYLLAGDLFILTLVIAALGFFSQLVPKMDFRLLFPVATASYFIYLFHRPVWAVFDFLFHLQFSALQVVVRLIPASLIIIIICYYLQIGYDRLLHRLKF